jgi:peptide deformylase
MTIVTSPNKILFQKARNVRVFDDSLKKLVGDMIPTMREADGMGLAAPQIGKSLRIAVVEFTPKTDEEKKYSPVPLTILVNPKIIHHSKTTNVAEEGCLSLPKINLDVPRYDEVTIIYQDVEGTRHKIKSSDLAARVLQHEIDHLNGILITDRHNEFTNAQNVTSEN